jgi:hypothetical protein
MRRSAVIARCAVAVLAAVAAQTAHAATAQQAIALLNAQRAANGLPAGIVQDPTLTSDCAAHDRYMAINQQLTHYEQPEDPGYSAGGAYAGKNSVLSEGDSWDSADPYESAPLHLDQLLAPRLRTVGSADVSGFSCTTTFPGWTGPDPAAPTVYTYPGNGSAIYPSEVARELPWTPGELAGLPQGTETGPYVIVLVDAPGQSPFDNPASLSSAIIDGPSGSLDVKTVDGETPVPGGTLGPYLYPGGFIIPVNPLIPGATYQAHVVVTFAGVQTPHDWSFMAAGADPHSSLTARRETLGFASRSPQPVRVTFTRSGGRHARGVTIRPGRAVHLHLSPGSWQACGHQVGIDGYAAYDACVAIIVTGVPKLYLGSGHRHGGQVRFALRYSAVLRGRTATLTITPLRVRCSHQVCRTTSGQPSTRAITLSAKALSLALPARGQGVRLELTTNAFQLRDAPWTSARAQVLFVRGQG